MLQSGVFFSLWQQMVTKLLIVRSVELSPSCGVSRSSMICFNEF